MIRFAMFFFDVFFILNVLTLILIFFFILNVLSVILKISFGDLCVCLICFLIFFLNFVFCCCFCV